MQTDYLIQKMQMATGITTKMTKLILALQLLQRTKTAGGM